MTEVLYHLGVSSAEVPLHVVLVEPDLQRLRWPAAWERRQLARRREFSSFVLAGPDAEVLVCVGGTGSPAVVIAQEELVRAGARSVLGLTRCRCVDCGRAEARHGAVVAVGASRGERTSLDYAPVEFPAVPDPRLMLALLAALPGTAGEVVCTVDVPVSWSGDGAGSAQADQPTHGPVDLCSSAMFVAGASSGAAVATIVVPAGGDDAVDLTAALAAFVAVTRRGASA